MFGRVPPAAATTAPQIASLHTEFLAR